MYISGINVFEVINPEKATYFLEGFVRLISQMLVLENQYIISGKIEPESSQLFRIEPSINIGKNPVLVRQGFSTSLLLILYRIPERQGF